ncbi:MAG: hypothetical protein QOG62_65 [Thermoleophilaceae bacterium]|nr:hypothetical protein [Thermoleophilaceae bacterium]
MQRIAKANDQNRPAPGEPVLEWTESPPPPRPKFRLPGPAGCAVILAMVVGAASMFTVVPLVCLWVASMLTSSQVAGILAALVSVPVAMIAFGSQLVRLDNLYVRVTAWDRGPRVAPAYRRGLTDTNFNRPTSVLDRVMVAAVMIALAVDSVWFFLFAGSPLPS